MDEACDSIGSDGQIEESTIVLPRELQLKIRFSGNILPTHLNINEHFTLNLGVHGSSEKITMEIKFSGNTVSADCDYEVMESQSDMNGAYRTAYEYTRSIADAIAMRRGHGIVFIFDKASVDGSIEIEIPLVDRELAAISEKFWPSFGLSFPELAFILMANDNLRRAVHDLVTGLHDPLQGRIVAARAIDAIRFIFAAGRAPNDSGWLLMQINLNVSKDFLSLITDRSKGPRHGDYFDGRLDGHKDRIAAKRAWVVMVRFLNFYIRNAGALSITEFPLLTDKSVI